MKWVGEHRIEGRLRLDTTATANPAVDTDRFLVEDANGLVGYRTGAEVLADIGGLSTAATAAAAALLTTVNQASDTTCFPVFMGAATGDLAAQTNAALTFDSTIGELGCSRLSSTYSAIDSGGNPTLHLNGKSGQAARLELSEDLDNGTSYVRISVPPLAANVVMTLPGDDGDADDFLKTDGAGNLSWDAVSSGGSSSIMTMGGRVQHTTAQDGSMILCGSTYGLTYYIYYTSIGTTASGGGTVDSTTLYLNPIIQHYGSMRVPAAGKVRVDILGRPYSSSSYSKNYVIQLWEFTPALNTSTGPTCTLRAKSQMTSSSSTSHIYSADMTSTSDITAGNYVFVTIGMDAQTLTTTAYQYLDINVSLIP